MNKQLSYTCPHCNGEMTFAPEHRGIDSQCPHCQKEIILGGNLAKQQQERAAKEKAEYEAWKRTLKPDSSPPPRPPQIKSASLHTFSGTDYCMDCGWEREYIERTGRECSKEKSTVQGNLEKPFKQINDTELTVRRFLEGQFAKDPNMRTATIQHFKLTHLTGNNYRGLITVKTALQIESMNVEVIYDGTNIEVGNPTEHETHNTTMKQMLLVLLLAFSIGMLIWQITNVEANPNFVTLAGLAVCIACSISFLVTFIKNCR